PADLPMKHFSHSPRSTKGTSRHSVTMRSEEVMFSPSLCLTACSMGCVDGYGERYSERASYN
ncbi:MAG: hypothetical protein ACKOOA_11065, partial [Sediminibacterium sp.]